MSILDNLLGPSLRLNAAGAGTYTALHALMPDIHYRGVIVVVTIDAITAGDSWTVSIVGYDPTSQWYYPLLTSVPLTQVGHTVLTVYPGIVAVPNVAANSPVPNSNFWSVQGVVATGPITGYCSCVYCY
jgi:hypothetical protein